VRSLLDLPGAVLLEVGPGQTLTTLAHQQRGNAPRRSWRRCQSAPRRSAVASETMLGALGRLWAAGIQPDWKRFWSHERRQRVSLPTTPLSAKSTG
jgi:phthiocerol/phenolphthiocerol synthesis type-I polyketide synthase E